MNNAHTASWLYSTREQYPTNVTYVAIPLLRLTPPTDGFPWDDLRKVLHGGQRMAKAQNGEEVLPKVSTP